MKKLRLSVLTCAAALLFTADMASAEPAKPADYPNRPINFVVSYPPGGGMDVTARTLAAQMERVTGYQFRVENRPGGASIIGNTYVAKQAQADGYTVGVLANPTLAINILGQGAHFEKTDLVPVAGITFEPVVWFTQSKSKFGKMDFNGFIDEAKSHPDEVKVGVIPNAAFDMATRILEKERGVKFNIVPFQGGKPSLVALLGGNIDVSANYYSEVEQYMKSGDVKALAVSDNTPAPKLPDVPTMKDLNVKMAPGTWGADRFAAVPKGVPDDRKQYLAFLIQKTLADKRTAEAFQKVGIDIAPLTAEQEQARYDEAYSAVSDFLKDAKASGGK
jgi:putative tricarboxylic transport membrane protein